MTVELIVYKTPLISRIWWRIAFDIDAKTLEQEQFMVSPPVPAPRVNGCQQPGHDALSPDEGAPLFQTHVV